MFAIVKTGGKQYRVKENQILKAEKIEAEVGAVIQLSEILALHDGKSLKIDPSEMKDAVVEAKVVAQARQPKVIIFKKKRRHNYRRKKGHRQPMTILRIVTIKG